MHSMRACATFWVLPFVPLLAAAASPVDYTRDVKPLLARNCAACHGPEKQRSSLRLDGVARIRKGGNSGPAIVPGKSDESLLIKAVSGADGTTAMPPKGKRLT